jgi:hypothetical protein
MSDYKINLVVTTYFSVLMDRNISEKQVKDSYQKNGILYIELTDGQIITEKIKNYYNE